MGKIQASNTATILSGQTVSDVVYLGEKVPVMLVMPAAFTGATVTFQSSADGVAYQALNIAAGTAYTLTVAASKNVSIDGTMFYGARYLKIVSASAEGATRSLVLVARAVGI